MAEKTNEPAGYTDNIQICVIVALAKDNNLCFVYLISNEIKYDFS